MQGETYTTEELMKLLRRLTRLEICCYTEGLPNALPLILDIRDILTRLSLTERERKVLELYFFKEYTQEEVAKEIGTSQVTVSSTIRSIKKSINEVLLND